MSQSEEQPSVSDQIFGMNATMVGRFDALDKRLDELERTLTDDALALSGEHEALIAKIREQLLHKGSIGSGVDHIYALVWEMVNKMKLDPHAIVEEMNESMKGVDD